MLDRKTGKVHQFNPTASFIWIRMGTAPTEEDIAEELAKEFEVDSATALRDVQRVVEELRELDLLECE